MEALNYKSDLMPLENAIADQTIVANRDAVQVLAANLNSLYGMMLSREGLQNDVFHISSPERAVRFWVSVHSMAAFQFASTIADHVLNGKYSEAAALIRSLIEVSAFSEYYILSPEVAFSAIRDVTSIPTRTVVFRKLAKDGRWPVGGPRQAFERYNLAAHGHIAHVLQHSAQAEDGPPSISRIWLRRFNQDSFHRLARDTMMPLIGIQEMYRRELILESAQGPDEAWKSYWSIGHDRAALTRAFPTLSLGYEESTRPPKER